MAQPVIIIGAGGFGREILDVIDAVNLNLPVGDDDGYLEFLGFLDDGGPDLGLLQARGASHLGPVHLLEELPEDVGYLIGIGDGAVRARIDAYGRSLGRHSPAIIHPSATFGFDVQLGAGSVVCSHASLTNNIRVGRHVHLNLNCTVGHDTNLHDYVTVSPLVAISGEVNVEERAMLGTGSTVNQGLTIGAGAILGAGAAAVKNIPAGITAVGVPAKAR